MTDDIRFEPQDSQGLTVWERLDACDRAILHLTAQVTTLEQQYAQMQNDLSLLPSIQRAHMDLEKRLTALESEAPMLYGFGEPKSDTASAAPAPPRPAVYVPFGAIDKLVEQVESMFECKDGDHRAAHQVWNGSRRAFDVYEYTVVGLRALASLPDAQERLRQALYTSFHKLKLTCKSARPVLYWRYSAASRVQEDVEYVDGVRELTPTKYKIMTRFAIPEADFSVIGWMAKADTAPYVVLVQ